MPIGQVWAADQDGPSRLHLLPSSGFLEREEEGFWEGGGGGVDTDYHYTGASPEEPRVGGNVASCFFENVPCSVVTQDIINLIGLQ